MVFSHDVDICVTCVTDKPPKLPLREELVSLGVEVIYKAAGVAVKAARRESIRQVMEYREQIQKMNAESEHSSGTYQGPEEEMQQRVRQRMVEKEIYNRRSSLTYEAYAQRLTRQNSSDSESLSSLNSVPQIRGDTQVSARGSIGQLGIETDERDGATSPVTNHPDGQVQEAFLYGKAVKVGLESSLSPSKSNLLSIEHPTSPQTAATSPTLSHTTFGTNCDDEVSPVRDDDSVGSTFGKEDGKTLVSASGSRWWYQQNDVPKSHASHESRAVNTDDVHEYPPLIPMLSAGEQNESHAVPEALEKGSNRGSICSPCFSRTYNTVWGCGVGDTPHEETAEVITEDPIEESLQLDSVSLEAASKPAPVADGSGPWLFCAFADICGGLSRVQHRIPENEKTVENATIKSDNTDIISNKWREVDAVMSDRSSTGDNADISHYPADEDRLIDNNEGELGCSQSSSSSASRSRGVLEALSTSSELSQIVSMPGDSRTAAYPSSDDAGNSDGRRSKRQLFSSLSQSVVSIDDIQSQLRKFPALAWAMTSYDGRLALHAACDRNLPDRFSDRSVTLVNRTLDLLVTDIIDWKSVVNAILVFNVNACNNVDKSGDLPSHIAARRLIEWEGHWRTRLAGVSVLDQEDIDKINILYCEMSLCVEILLDPILCSRYLCQEQGSIGRILPLHMACIFSISSEKTKTLLRTYSDAASVPCIIRDLLTLIEDNSFALELLERERAIGVSEDSNPRGRDSESIEPTLSDLLFAFYPEIQPFCSDPIRLTRSESLVRNAARDLQRSKEIGGHIVMDSAAQSVWVWLCTCRCEGEVKGCADNVARIVNSLEVEEVANLAYLETDLGTILSIASQECVSILKSRLVGSAERNVEAAEDVAPPLTMSVRPDSSPPPSALTGLTNKQFAPNAKAQPSTKIFGLMLKEVFNVRETLHPSSFIILPYKLVTGANGSLTLEDPTSASMALKFAQYLLEMTHPAYLVHQLEKKAIQHATYKVPAPQMEQWTLTEEKHRNIQREFVDVYRTGPGYLYLLDEKDSIPIIKGEKDEKYYPIRIEDPVGTVRRMLPLMLMGMVHMRGRKSLSILGNTIVEGGPSVPDRWVVTAETILELLAVDISDQDTAVSAAISCRDDLQQFVDTARRGDLQRRSSTTEDGYEWVVELTLLKIVLERSDIRRSFAGLTPISMQTGEIVWTKSKINLPSHSEQRSGSFDADSHGETQSSPSDDLERLLGDFSSDKGGVVALKTIDGSVSEDDHQLRQTSTMRQKTPSLSKSICSTESLQSLGSTKSASQEKFNWSDASTSNDTQSESAWKRLVLSDTGELDLILRDSHSQSNRLPPVSCISVASWPSSGDSKGSGQSIQSSQCVTKNESRNWRYQLEKQEALLEHIRDKLAVLDMSDEDQLSLCGEALIDDISQHLNTYDATAATACYGDGEVNDLEIDEEEDTTKKLLLRLCELEERLLSREIDLEQIKLELHNFELEAVSRSDQWEFTVF